jgi:hypothetical protein
MTTEIGTQAGSPLCSSSGVKALLVVCVLLVSGVVSVVPEVVSLVSGGAVEAEAEPLAGVEALALGGAEALALADGLVVGAAVLAPAGVLVGTVTFVGFFVGALVGRGFFVGALVGVLVGVGFTTGGRIPGCRWPEPSCHAHATEPSCGIVREASPFWEYTQRPSLPFDQNSAQYFVPSPWHVAPAGFASTWQTDPSRLRVTETLTSRKTAAAVLEPGAPSQALLTPPPAPRASTTAVIPELWQTAAAAGEEVSPTSPAAAASATATSPARRAPR